MMRGTLAGRWMAPLGLLLTATAWAQPNDTPRRQFRPQPPASAPARPEELGGAVRVVLEIAHGGTDWGRIVLQLDSEKAPETAANFLRLVDEGFYDGTIFHRVLANFMIQSGGYSAPDEAKRPRAHRPLRNEARNGLKNVRGSVAMARSRNPHSATTQFFINVKDNPQLDAPSWDGWGYCVFGRVIEGMAVVDRIREVPTKAARDVGADRAPSLPVDPPLIRRAYRAERAPDTPPPTVEHEAVPPALEAPFEHETPPPSDEPPPPMPPSGPQPDEPPTTEPSQPISDRIGVLRGGAAQG